VLRLNSPPVTDCCQPITECYRHTSHEVCIVINGCTQATGPVSPDHVHGKPWHATLCHATSAQQQHALSCEDRRACMHSTHRLHAHQHKHTCIKTYLYTGFTCKRGPSADCLAHTPHTLVCLSQQLWLIKPSGSCNGACVCAPLCRALPPADHCTSFSETCQCTHHTKHRCTQNQSMKWPGFPAFRPLWQ
jgi:hypothetical protein